MTRSNTSHNVKTNISENERIQAKDFYQLNLLKQ